MVVRATPDGNVWRSERVKVQVSSVAFTPVLLAVRDESVPNAW
jgi:hypothetical protein